MALRLRSNPAPLNGALYVSNPKRKKSSSKRRKRAVSKVRKNRRNPVKKNRKNRKNPIKLKKNGLVVKKNRKNPVRKKKRVVRKRKNTVAKKRKNSVSIRKRKNGTKKGMRRKTARKAYMRKRKNGTKKGMARKTARRAYMKNRKNRKNRRNPVRNRKNRKNRKNKVKVIRRNTNALSLGFLKPIENLVKKVPFIGKKIAPYTQPAILGMVGAGGVVLGMNSVGKVPFVGQYAKYPLGHAFGYTVMGFGLALVSALLPVKSATKKTLAVSCAIAGGAINASQLVMTGFDLQAVKQQNLDMLGVDEDLSLDESVAGLSYGDGMYYEVQPLSGLVADMSGLDYESAQLGDAHACPHDLDHEEGKMAVLGKEAYFKKFGTPPKKKFGQKTYYSLMAGKKGHRWGWLIKSLGYERFKQLASLPPQQRIIMIKKLKASAIQASQATFDSELTGSLSGLDYNLDMSGLSIDSLSGIAVAGAGI